MGYSVINEILMLSTQDGKIVCDRKRISAHIPFYLTKGSYSKSGAHEVSRRYIRYISYIIEH
jgi:hypothetical protein